MSTNALDATARNVPDLYSSLEYLVAPVPTRLLGDAPGGDALGPHEHSLENEVNNSLQKLTNLVYLLGQQARYEDQLRSAVTLMQAELAHLTVLVRKEAVREKRAQAEQQSRPVL